MTTELTNEQKDLLIEIVSNQSNELNGLLTTTVAILKTGQKITPKVKEDIFEIIRSAEMLTEILFYCWNTTEPIGKTKKALLGLEANLVKYKELRGVFDLAVVPNDE